jgi:hypothetical protein
MLAHITLLRNTVNDTVRVFSVLKVEPVLRSNIDTFMLNACI